VTESKSWRGIADRIADLMAGRGAHPSRTLVLVPYAQLMRVARDAWAARGARGFAPRFETTRSWALARGGFLPQADDIAFDMARDLVTAQSLLARAGLGAARHALAGRLVETALQLAPPAAAQAPDERTAWGRRLRDSIDVGRGSEWFDAESALNGIALAWAASSGYATDVLFSGDALARVEQLIVLDGLQPDPLTRALAGRLGERCAHLPLAGESAPAAVGLHAAGDAEDEAERAAACVLRHLEAGRAPVALVATDRALTRRVSAQLAAHGVMPRDETGWKLSTTRAAAGLMSALRACAHDAGSDQVLDWLKNAAAFDRAAVSSLEARLRERGMRDWSAWCSWARAQLPSPQGEGRGGGRRRSIVNDGSGNANAVDPHPGPSLEGAVAKLPPPQGEGRGGGRRRSILNDGSGNANAVDPHPGPPLEGEGGHGLPPAGEGETVWQRIEALRAGMMRARPLGEWLAATRALLQADGQWPGLASDVAGVEVISALHLNAGDDEIRGARCTQAEFIAWARDVLEAASFVPAAPDEAESACVVILPLHHLLGRAFAAVVAPGCDDQRLPASPEPPGHWSAAQRAALSLPSREALESAQRAAWAVALGAPHCDVLWRRFDANGEPVRPSPLAQLLALDGADSAPDPRRRVRVAAQPTPPPRAHGDALMPATLSSTAYEDLRRCPYRFFALRQLGLRGSDELDAELDKRDFGNWLHAVLGHFHEALKNDPASDREARRALMAVAQARATREFALSEAEFLPFAAAWPAVREGYLSWLAEHEAREGAVFVESEPWKETPLGRVKLVGRLDRVDATPDGRVFVIDYKTESESKTRERVKDPHEDTQLAFYAALLPDDTLRAAYVNVGEKATGTHTFEQKDIVQARDALVAGVIDDLDRIAEGAPLPALGEGQVCEHCAARGLCRKDFWE
jgi:RecB family exonuclease